jgi:hypothetical protein
MSPADVERAARVGPEAARETAADTANSTTPEANAQSGRADLPQFRNRRAFLIWALMAGYTKPERVVERVVAELEEETT